MTDPKPLVSICIPTYNGAKTLSQTVQSILNQLEPSVEVVFCDDSSTDHTWELIQSFAQKYSCIRAFRNQKNLGMDLNFQKTALCAQSRFVWFCGQDDLFSPGVIRKVLTVLQDKPELGFVYINYSQWNHSMDQMLCSSVLREEWRSPTLWKEDVDYYFSSYQEYFAHFDSVPTFLPATVIRREVWDTTDVSQYVGTAFIQSALILLNMRKYPSSYVITQVMVRGCIPDDRWQKNGQSYFSIMLGGLLYEAMVAQDPRNPIPQEVYLPKKRRFLKSFFALVRESKRMGMRPKPIHRRHLRLIFGRGLIYYGMLLPILYAPRALLSGIHRLYQRAWCN